MIPSKIFSGLKIIGCVLNLNSSGLVNYSAARHSKRHRKILTISYQKLQRRTRSQNYELRSRECSVSFFSTLKEQFYDKRGT